jgi:hypothetical protein
MPVKVLADLRRVSTRSHAGLASERPAASLDALRFAACAVSRWLEPQLVAEITYLTWTADNLLRHTVYVGLREDKPATKVRRNRAPNADRSPLGCDHLCYASSQQVRIIWLRHKDRAGRQAVFSHPRMPRSYDYLTSGHRP